MTAVTNLGAAVFRGEPGRTALVDLSGAVARQFTFGDIDCLSGAAAQAMLARGLNSGDRVAILSDNRAEVLWVFLGAMRAGLAAMPVNHKLPAATVALVLADCGARLMFADAAHEALVPTGLPAVAMEAFRAGRTSILAGSRPSSNPTPPSRMPASWRFRTRSRAPSLPPSSCSAPART